MLAVNASDASPDDASRAYDLSQVTGANPALIHTDTDAFNNKVKAGLTSKLILDNSFLADYARSHPLAPAISNDDWGGLDKAARLMDRVTGGKAGILTALAKQVPISQQPTSSLQDFASEFAKSWDESTPQTPFYSIDDDHLANLRQTSPALAAGLEHGLNVIARNPLLAGPGSPLFLPEAMYQDVPRLFSAGIAGIRGAGLNLLRRFGMSEGNATSLANELSGMAEWGMMRGDVGTMGHELGQEIGMDEAAQVRVNQALKLAEPYLKAGEEPPKGLHPLIDQLHAIQSMIDADHGEEAVKAVDDTNTAQRNMNFTREHFLSLFPNPFIEVDAAAIRKLYGDKQPEADDGLFGFLLNFRDQMDQAALTGDKISIPLHDWISKVDPEIRKELKDQVAWRPGGFTREEAKEAMKPVEAPAPEDQPKLLSGDPTVDAVREGANLHRDWSSVGPPDRTDFIRFLPSPDQLIKGEFTATDPAARGITVPTHHTTTVGELYKQVNFRYLDGVGKALNQFFGDHINRLVGDMPVHIISKDDMEKLNQDVGFIPAGFYHNGRIVLRDDVVDGSQPAWYSNAVIQHEASHAATVNAILTHPSMIADIRSIMDEADKYLTLNAPDARKQHDYAFRNEREFVAEFQSKAALQGHLAQVPISKELAKKLGITGRRPTAWDAVRHLVRRIFEQIFGKQLPTSAFDAMMNVSERLEKIQNDFEWHYTEQGGISGQSKLRSEEPTAPTPPEKLPEPGEKPLFEQGKTLGLAEKHYRRLLEFAQRQRAEDLEYLQKKMQAEEAVRQTKEWKENFSAIRDEVKDAIVHRPDIAADVFLRTGELYGVKYRRARLDGSKLSMEQNKGLNEEYFSNERGHDPEAVAGLLGFQSADEMVDALKTLDQQREAEGLTHAAHLTKIIDQNTERVMMQRYGKLAENILKEAEEHVLSTTQGDILHEETLRYATMGGMAAPLKKADIGEMAANAFDNMTDGKVNSRRMLENVGRLGRRIEAAESAGDWTEAMRLSQQREIQFQQSRLALKYEKHVARFTKIAKRFRPQDPNVKIPLEYTGVIQTILKQIGETVNRSDADIARVLDTQGYKGVQDFIEKKTNTDLFEEDPNFPNENVTITVAPWLLDPGFKRPLADMTVQEARATMNSVESVYKNGVAEGKFLARGEAEDLQEFVDKFVQRLKDIFGQKPEGLPPGAPRDRLMKTYLASLVQVESLWNRLSKGDFDDFIMKSISRPTMEAGNARDALERQIAKMYNDLGAFPDLQKKVSNHLFFDPRERFQDQATSPMDMTRKHLLTVLQNVGNYSNFDKLGRGFGVYGRDEKGKAIGSEHLENIRKYGYRMDMNDSIMNWIFRNTTKDDWDRAQKLGKIFEKLFSMSEDVYSNLGAMPGPKIDLKPIETPFGTYDGWYHPVVYDPSRPGSSVRLMGPQALEDGSYYRATTPAGYQKGRTGYAAPIDLSFSAIPFRMRQMISDISMRPVVTELSKLFYNKDFSTAMSRYYGRETEKLLVPYLKDIAGQRKYKDAVQREGEYWAEWTYQNLVATMIGLNPSTVLKHLPTALMNSVREVGAGTFFKHFGQMWFTPSGWRDFDWMMNGGHVDGFGQWGGSEELQRRARNWYETLGGTHFELFKGEKTGVGGFAEKFRQFMIKAGATPVAWSDMASAGAMWKAAYTNAMDEGRAHGDAVSFADMAVRRAHGSTAITARPRIMRGGPLARATAPFYTFFNDMLQRQYETAWRAREGANYISNGDYQKGLKELGKVGFNMWTYVVFPAIVEQVISPVVYNPNTPWEEKIAGMMSRDVAASFPGIRDVVDFMLSGRDPSVGLYNEYFHSIQDVWRDAQRGHISLNREHAGKTIKHVGTFLGALTGIGNAQIGRGGQFAYDYATGHQTPHDLAGWYRALRTGDVHSKLLTPAQALENVIR